MSVTKEFPLAVKIPSNCIIAVLNNAAPDCVPNNNVAGKLSPEKQWSADTEMNGIS